MRVTKNSAAGNRIFISGIMQTIGFEGNKMLLFVDPDEFTGYPPALVARVLGANVDILYEGLAHVNDQGMFPDSDDPTNNFLQKIVHIQNDPEKGDQRKINRDRMWVAFGSK